MPNVAAAIAQLEAADAAAATSSTESPADGTPPVEGTPAAAGETPPAEEKTAAQLRKEKLDEQLADLRARRAERRTDGEIARAKQAAAETARAADERMARATAEREKWEAITKSRNPVEAIRAQGLDVGETFLALSKAAQEASTPEAKIAALEELLKASNARMESFIEAEQRAKQEQLQRHEQEAQARTVRDAEESVLSLITPEKAPFAAAYFTPEALREIAHKAADDIRSEKKREPLSFEEVAQKIEEEVRKHHAAVVQRLGTVNGATKSDGAQASVNSQGLATQARTAAGTLTNDLASETASNPKRRKTLHERQREAAAMLEAQDRAQTRR